jgi:3-oxoacyl-[acyl-carrier protein] reductase
MFDLGGRHALVTGASGGIGAGIARALAARRARVTLTGRSEPALAALGRELGGVAHAVVADLCDADATIRLVQSAATAFGTVHILVNNAGISGEGSLLELEEDAWRSMIEVNLNAVYRLTRAALPGMLAAGFGRIVNIGSILGTSGAAGLSHYAASKAGLVGFTKSLAAEVAARGITVNCIAPGYIRTRMMDWAGEEDRSRLLARIPVGFFGEPADVAAAVVYLASREARFITGETLHCNGGMAMI